MAWNLAAAAAAAPIAPITTAPPVTPGAQATPVTAATPVALVTSAPPAAEPDAEELAAAIEGLLERRQFDALDAAAVAWRNPDARLKGGNSRLYHFYGALGSFAGAPCLGAVSRIPFERKRRLLQDWIEARPAVSAARIATAQLWLNLAWQGRGTAMPDRVTEAGWRSYAEGLGQASVQLAGLDPKSDPHIRFLLMAAAAGAAHPAGDLDAVYAAAIRDYPSYFHYYSQRAKAVLALSSGSPSALATLLITVLQTPGGDNGLVAYSYVTFILFDFYQASDPYQHAGLSWPLIEAAYTARERRFGLRNRDWNVLCKLAVLAHDPIAAGKWLARIGANWDESVWHKRQNFDAAVAWIRGGGALTPAETTWQAVQRQPHGGGWPGSNSGSQSKSTNPSRA